MKQKRFLSIVRKICEIIHDFGYKCAARAKPAYFSREGGKIGFTNMIGITLNFLAKSVQKELNGFFEHVIGKTESVSKQAYNEARYKLTVDAFRILYNATAESAAQDSGLSTYKGYRVLPVDGTTLQLENTYALRLHYGTTGGGEGIAMARASVMADVLNCGLILDARISPLSCGERELAMLHLDRLQELGIENPLPTYDRGYASAELIDAHVKRGIDFLFRLQKGFNARIDRMPLGDYTKKITIKKHVFRLRILKFMLPGGEIETLITSLPKTSITADELAHLYNLRWGVETAYGMIKSILQIGALPSSLSSRISLRQCSLKTWLRSQSLIQMKLWERPSKVISISG